jgi:hypothetical protein
MKLNIEIPDELLSRATEQASPPAAGPTDARSGGAAPDSVAVGRVGPASVEQALSAGAAEQAAGPVERLGQASADGMDGGTAPA